MEDSSPDGDEDADEKVCGGNFFIWCWKPSSVTSQVSDVMYDFPLCPYIVSIQQNLKKKNRAHDFKDKATLLPAGKHGRNIPQNCKHILKN